MSAPLDYTIAPNVRSPSFILQRDAIIAAGPAASSWPAFFAAYDDKIEQDRRELISARRLAEEQFPAFTAAWSAEHATVVLTLPVAVKNGWL